MPDVSPYVFAGIAAVCAEMVTFPLDTAKTRLQLQGQARDKRWVQVRYRGTLHCLGIMVREEGLRYVYKGLSPALVRQLVYGSIKFGLYNTCTKELAVKYKYRQESGLVKIGCGVFAGSVSSAIATPMDVIKVRMQGRATEGLGGLVMVARDIYTKEGVAGLWRGVCPTSQRAALLAGVQLPVYDWAKYRLSSGPTPIMKDGISCHILSSSLAAFSAAVASNPVDVVRTRLMIQRRHARNHVLQENVTIVYRSAVHCGLHTVKQEGFGALYKGFLPSFTRMGPWNIIFFVVYEQLKALKKKY